jgi:hypothetical protein
VRIRGTARVRALAGAVKAEDRPLPGDERLVGIRAQAADRLPSIPPRPDESGRSQPSDMPADQRLRQPNLFDQIRDRRASAGEATDDPKAVDIRQRLMDDPQLA